MRFIKDTSLIPEISPLKPFKFPPGFTLIQDTREQRPLFKSDKSIPFITSTLHDGDYTIQGLEGQIAFERKQISDLYSYIGKERKKTIAKMERFRQIVQKNHGFVALIIEATEESILFGNQFSKITPEMVRQALVSFQIRYGIHVYYSDDRDYLRRYVLDHAIKFYKVLREV